ncbi:MAG: AgmX/PglI C-terminal domain-containing protein [Deltaproteobacteria bacterium]|nr:AgmX/PglI C-terminal domain-containing protein [Deltaproteobacteria bacterium]
MSRPCKGNTSRLVALMDGSLRPSAADRLREHLKGCPACETAYARLQQVRGVCRELGQAEPPELPFKQIEAQIRWRISQLDERKRPRVRWPRLAAGLTAAAALGALAGILVYRHLSPREGLRAPERGTLARRGATLAPGIAPSDPRTALAALGTLVGGDVTVAGSDGSRRALTLRQRLSEGDRLVTGKGYAAVQWGAGTGLRLGNGGELELRRLRPGEQELVLWQGALDLEVAKRAPGSRFDVLAAGLRATVKGTRFRVSTDGRAANVEVTEGEVAVQPQRGAWQRMTVPAGAAGTTASVVVRPGQKLSVTASGVAELSTVEGPQLRTALNLQPWPSLERVLSATGLLAVETRPEDAELRLDAVRLGPTNLMLRGAIGRHLIELWRDGKLLRQEWVVLRSNEEHRLAVDLRRQPAAQPRPAVPAELHDAIRSYAVQIRGCYERRLKHAPELAGRFVLRLVIDDEGQVSRAAVERDTLTDPLVGQCALQVVRRWRFPSGLAGEVAYPFTFRAQ